MSRPTKRHVGGRRRALSHIGGPIEAHGSDGSDVTLATAAFDVTPSEEASRAHVHGFHSYPARVDPRTARRLVEGLCRRGAAVLDPFCGSGTVLVEARLAGRTPVGIDANPLAVELAWLKVRGTTAKERFAISEAAARVTAHAEKRRSLRAGPTQRYGAEDVALFDPHVLLELDGLKDGIGRERDENLARVLRLVLSAILIKVSRRQGDSSARLGPKRLASGYTIRLFGAKTEELVRRLAAFASMLPEDAPAPMARVGDARKLEGIRDGSIAAIVTSPPYAGTYDYLAHHAARLRWLGIEPTSFAQSEIGARRHFTELSFSQAIARWDADFTAALLAMRRVLASDGVAALVLGDSAAGTRPILADRTVRKLAPRAGLRVSAIVSQARPHFHGPTMRAFRETPRREHLILLRPE